MDLEKIIGILIILHALAGGAALVAGAVALASKKGSKRHKKTGKGFYYLMLSSASLAFVVAVMPNHESPFLFSIGVFSIYFLISGYRSLRYKQDEFELKFDKAVAIIIILTGLIMIAYPIILYSKLNIILAVFGAVGIIFGSRDLVLFKNVEKLQKSWLKLHLGKMIGGYIAAVTAFFVVNEILPGMYNWFVPGIIGGGYIAFWMRKLR